MYENNYLVASLRSASVGREMDVFIKGTDGRTFGDFFGNAEKYARVLSELGVRAGDRVAVQVDKSIEALELYVGTVMAGAVFFGTGSRISSSKETPAALSCSATIKRRSLLQTTSGVENSSPQTRAIVS